MEFTTHKDTLMTALSRAKGVVEKKTTMPILTNIQLESKASDRISIKATDLELSLEGLYEVDVQDAGGFCMPAVKFFDVVRAMPAGNITVKLNAETNKAEVRGDKGAFFQLFTVPVEDYPTLPATEGVELYPIDAAMLKDALGFALPAAGTDDPRVYLNSIYVENKGDGKLRFVSTDGHKLALIDKDVASNLPMAKGVIIPRKAVQEILRLLDDGDLGEVSLGFSENHGFFVTEHISFSFRLIDSTYPNYEMVVPGEATKKIKVKRSELVEAIGRISVLAAERNSKMRMDVEPGNMMVSYNSPEYGSSQQPVDMEMLLGEEAFALGFTTNTLLEIIKIFPQENIVLNINTPETPVKVEGEEFDEGFGVVMPIKLEFLQDAYE